jgi:hypothetical protein
MALSYWASGDHSSFQESYECGPGNANTDFTTDEWAEAFAEAEKYSETLIQRIGSIINYERRYVPATKE